MESTVRPGLFQHMTERLLRSPAVYDLVQLLAGERTVRDRLALHLRRWPPHTRVLDIGGGTGLARRAVATDRYVCMDLDLAKLQRFRRVDSKRMAVLADAAGCPFAAESMDGVLCAKVVHHLSDPTLAGMLAESARILKPTGTFLLVDAVRSPRWTSRLMWRLDRGSHPRTGPEIRRAVASQYAVTVWEEFRVARCHEFVLCVGRKLPAHVEAERLGDGCLRT